jgi:hypothetical protein
MRFCKICLLVTDDRCPLIQEHHLIPKAMHDISKVNKDMNKTIDLCPNCHKIAHMIINKAIMNAPFVQFWDEKELVKAGRKFRKENLRKMGKY